jgi:hypothetical protein
MKIKDVFEMKQQELLDDKDATSQGVITKDKFFEIRRKVKAMFKKYGSNIHDGGRTLVINIGDDGVSEDEALKISTKAGKELVTLLKSELNGMATLEKHEKHSKYPKYTVWFKILDRKGKEIGNVFAATGGPYAQTGFTLKTTK